MQQNFRWNMSNHMLSEEKTKSVLLPPQDMMLLLYCKISHQRGLVFALSKICLQFLIKVDDIKV